jgi:hypothetical protein
MFLVTLVYTVRCTLFYNYSYAILKDSVFFFKRDKLCSRVPGPLDSKMRLDTSQLSVSLAAVPVS